MTSTPQQMTDIVSVSIPLSEEQFGMIGKITAILAHVEHFMDVFIMRMMKIDNYFAYQDFLEGKQFGAKNGLLKKLAKYEPDIAISQAIMAAANKIDTIIGRRNHAIHGTWGLLFDTIQEGSHASGGTIAAHSNKKSDRPFLQEELPKLLADVDEVASVVIATFNRIYYNSEPDFPFRFIFCAHKSLP